MAGMEASTITSEGTCRLVMPLSELTMARSGPFWYAASISAFTPSATSGSRVSRPERMAARPLLALRPASASCWPYFWNSPGK